MDLELPGELLDLGAMLVTSVVEYQRNWAGHGVANLPQQVADVGGGDRAARGDAVQAMRHGVERSQQAVALAAAAGGNEDANQAPQISQEGAVDEMDRVDEQDRSLARSSLGQSRLEPLFQKPILSVGIGLGRQGSRLAPTKIEPFFKNSRVWVGPRRIPVKRSMSACACATVAGGCSLK